MAASQGTLFPGDPRGLDEAPQGTPQALRDGWSRIGPRPRHEQLRGSLPGSWTGLPARGPRVPARLGSAFLCVIEGMSERMHECMHDWMDGWMDGWMSGKTPHKALRGCMVAWNLSVCVRSQASCKPGDIGPSRALETPVVGIPRCDQVRDA